MVAREGGWKPNTHCIVSTQPENCTKTMLCEIIVASVRVLVNFKEQVGVLRKGDISLSDNVADHGQPRIQLVRNSRLSNVGLRNKCDSCLRFVVSVALSLWVSRYRPFLGLVRWPFVDLVSEVSSSQRRYEINARRHLGSQWNNSR